MIPILSDERQQNLEIMARGFSNMARRALISLLVEQEIVTTLDIRREFPALDSEQITQSVRPLVAAKMISSNFARGCGRGRPSAYSLTPAGRQALLDLHAELALLSTALEAHQ